MYPDSHFDNTQVTTTPGKIVDIIKDYWMTVEIVHDKGEKTYITPVDGDIYASKNNPGMIIFETVFGCLYICADEEIKVRICGEKDVIDEIRGRVQL